MKIVKRLFLGLFLFLLIAVIGALTFSYFYKDEIIARVKEDINKNFNATVDFGDIGFSVFKSFPDINLQLNDLSITGLDKFAGVPLVQADNIELDLDIMSVIKQEKPMKINAINLTHPKIHVIVLKDGKANYDIVKGSEEASPEASAEYNFLINLNEYSIKNGELIYDDRAGNVFLSLASLNHQGSGNFSETVFDLTTNTTIDEMIAKAGGVTYLNKAKGNLDMILNADLDNMRFTLKENALKINALILQADGNIAMKDNGDIAMDLQFNAPNNSFKNFLSLIPSAYTKDFADVQANGQLAFNGFAKGIYNDKGSLPAFKLDLDIKKGDFKYPALPMGVKNIFTEIHINSPSSNLDKMTINIPSFKMNLGNNPFAAQLALKTPISDPDVAAKIDGVIDLSDISKAFPLEGVKALNGIISSDIDINTRMSYVDKGQYDKVDMNGNVNISKLAYDASDMPLVKIANSDIKFTPRKATIENFRAQLGKSDIEARGSFDNILAYISPKQTLKGELLVRSHYFDANEWMTDTPPSNADTISTTNTSDVFDRFDFTLDALMEKVDYDVYKITNIVAKGRFKPSRLDLNKFALNMSNSDIQGSGKIDNVFGYLFDNGTLNGNINIESNRLDLNQMMADMEQSTEAQAKAISNEPVEPFIVPENIDMNITAKAKKINYTNIDLDNFNGKMSIANQAIDIQKANANMIGGKVLIDGKYDSKNQDNPGFAMDMTLDKFSFGKAFQSFNTFQQLAPIAKFLQGNFDTKFSINGVMGKDMMPDLNSLSAEGFLHTINAALKSFKPVDEVNNILNINALSNIKIKDTKNWFEVKDGKVEVKPFDFTYQDIQMKIGGHHSLSQEMNYLIKAKVPRALLQESNVGQLANKGLDFLSGQASKYGVNIMQGDYIDMDIKIGGTINQPKINIQPTGSGGKSFKETATDQFNDIKDKVIEEAKDKVNEEVDKAKAEAEKRARAEAEKLRKEAEERAKAEARKAAERLRKHIQDSIANAAAEKVTDAVGDKVKETVGEKAEEQVDKIKDKIGKWNPFKKKSGGR